MFNIVIIGLSKANKKKKTKKKQKKQKQKKKKKQKIILRAKKLEFLSSFCS